MSDLFEDDTPDARPSGDNALEFTVSEISGAVKRAVESGFSRVRVRGEIGRISRPRSGHLYLDLKDDRSVLAGVVWKGQAARLAMRPEEGMEVIASGRLTTFPGQSKYQMVIDTMAPAGVGALMAMLEKRRKALEAEGLFATDRKRPLPYLPEVIGVVTSPSGAVIRDILHRLRDRFPRKVLIWPVAVQGERCAPEVTRAIEGFNALTPGGALPRPDVLIVARGGGSVEDLWGFNEESVVRAAAASQIPLISAVGHETDTTLIDHAADRRAPTPTAAAEMAVPVRLDLLHAVEANGDRLARAAIQLVRLRQQRLRDLGRALPRPSALAEGPRQRLDFAADRLPRALDSRLQRDQTRLAQARAGLSSNLLRTRVSHAQATLTSLSKRLDLGLAAAQARNSATFGQIRARFGPSLILRSLATHGRDVQAVTRRLSQAQAAKLRQHRQSFAHTGARLTVKPLERAGDRNREALARISKRLQTAGLSMLKTRAERLRALDRVHQSFDHRTVLNRGFALVRDETGGLITSTKAAKDAGSLAIELHDGEISALVSGAKGKSKPARPTKAKPEQKSLFDP